MPYAVEVTKEVNSKQTFRFEEKTEDGLINGEYGVLDHSTGQVTTVDILLWIFSENIDFGHNVENFVI